MKKRQAFVCVVLGVIGACACSAAWASAPSSEGRYQLEKANGGYVRLDTNTGAITFCRLKGSDLLCSPAKAEATATQASIAAFASDDPELRWWLRDALVPPHHVAVGTVAMAPTAARTGSTEIDALKLIARDAMRTMRSWIAEARTTAKQQEK